MEKHLPARHYQNLKPDDLYTDTLRDSDGKDYAVTLTVRNWNNIDWIQRHAKFLTVEKLMDAAQFELKLNSCHTISDAVAHFLYHFVKSFQTAHKERRAGKSKETGRKERTGSA